MRQKMNHQGTKNTKKTLEGIASGSGSQKTIGDEVSDLAIWLC